LFLDDLHQHHLAALDNFLDLVLAARAEGALRHFLQNVVTADGFDDFLFGFFLAVLVLVVLFACFRSVFGMRRFSSLAVQGIGRLGGRRHGLGQSLGVEFSVGLGRSRLVRLGIGGSFGRNDRLGADRGDRRGRLIGMIMVVMMVLAVVAVLVIMGVMMVVMT